MLLVHSPRSLIRKKTENMYIPRQDKFEGYTQFPRPRLPPEHKATEHQFDSFITRHHTKHNNPIREILELKARQYDAKKAKKAVIARKTEEFLDNNVGYLTGTHTGGGKLKYTRASVS